MPPGGVEGMLPLPRRSPGPRMLLRASSRQSRRSGTCCRWLVPVHVPPVPSLRSLWSLHGTTGAEDQRLSLKLAALGEGGGMKSVSAMDALEEAEREEALKYARRVVGDERLMRGLPAGAVHCASLRFGLVGAGPQGPKSEEETAALLGVSTKRVRHLTRLVSRRIPLVPDRPEDGWPKLDVIFEDEHILVVAKPNNLRTAPVHRFMGHSLLARAIAHYGPPYDFVPHIVHRLDFGTSGVTVFGKTKEAAFRLSHQIQHHWVCKEYLALAVEDTEEGGQEGWQRGLRAVGDSWETALGIAPAAADGGVGIRREALALTDPRYSPTTEAFTEFMLVERGGSLRPGAAQASVLLHCKPRSGRTHQIRIHAEATGYPLIGEDLYCGRPELGLGPIPELGRQALHAWRLTLFHPVTCEQVSFAAPLPADMASVAASVGLKLDTLPEPQALDEVPEFASREWPALPRDARREKSILKRQGDLLKRDEAVARRSREDGVVLGQR